MSVVVAEVANDSNRCGEGPIWDHRRQCLWWTDLSGRTLFQMNPSTLAKCSFPLNHLASAIALDTSGALLLAGPEGLHLWNGQETRFSWSPTSNNEVLPLNDVVVDSHRRIYAGTLYLADNGIDVEKDGQLFLIDANGANRVVDEGFSISNGLSLSPDGSTLYHVDTGVRRVYAYTVDSETGGLSDRREFVEIREADGVPDGITVDAEGHVWCALWFSGKVVRYDADGKLQRTIDLPVSQASSLAFGGNSLKDLYVTTASECWNSPLAPSTFASSPKPYGGSLYRIELDEAGKLEHYVSFAKDAQLGAVNNDLSA